MALLHPGDRFPTFDVSLVGGDTLTLPDELGGEYGVVLFNRGSWCPFCVGQLQSFQRAAGRLGEAGVAKVVSLSVDDEATARTMIEEHGLEFPVGHSADADAIAAATGAFVNDEPRHLQSTGFVLDPDGNVVVSVYSSGAIGRLVPDDVAGLVTHLRDQ